MLSLFVHFLCAIDIASSQTVQTESPTDDRVIFVDQRQANIITATNALAQLQEIKRWLICLQTISTVTDYICQTTQIVLTVPQLAAHPSEIQGIWLNSFNLAAGIIAIAQIPTKKWIKTRLTETENAIAQIQTEQSPV